MWLSWMIGKISAREFGHTRDLQDQYSITLPTFSTGVKFANFPEYCADKILHKRCEPAPARDLRGKQRSHSASRRFAEMPQN